MMDGEKDSTKYAKTMAPALLDFLNPELPNPETWVVALDFFNESGYMMAARFPQGAAVCRA
jgi:hypothetical protein